jgi:hypothetical protein
MKSDHEFLKGVYKKAEELRNKDEMELKHSKESQFEWMNIKHRKMNYIYRYGTMAAIVTIIILATSNLITPTNHNELINNEPNPINNDPIGLNNKGTRTLNILDLLFDTSTDVVEIGFNSADENNKYLIVKNYKTNLEKDEILEVVYREDINLHENQTAIIFIQQSEDEKFILDVFFSDLYQEGTFINDYGDVITREGLENH